MEGTEKLQVKISDVFLEDLNDVFQFGVETFGSVQAEKHEAEVWQIIVNLSHNYLLFPECRHLRTKTKMYRWVILDSHLIIYRIKKDQVQVLRIIHSRRGVSYVRSSRRVKL